MPRHRQGWVTVHLSPAEVAYLFAKRHELEDAGTVAAGVRVEILEAMDVVRRLRGASLASDPDDPV